MKKEVMIRAGGLGLKVFCIVCIAIVSSVSATTSSELKYNDVGINGFRAELVHIDSPLFSTHNLTWTKWLERAVERSKQRLQSFNAGRIGKTKATDLGAAVNKGKGEFVMKLAIGTPGVAMAGIVDTGSDLTWTQCKPCTDCFAQSTPIFDPALSSSYKKLPCSHALCSIQALPEFSCKSIGCEYTYTYGDFSITVGILSSETFTFSLPKSEAKPSQAQVLFGCGHDNEGSGFDQASGIVGLGRGPLSLITQLGPSLDHKFSYCLTDSPSKSSTIFFGQAAALKDRDFRSTPFLVNHTGQSSYYYLPLQGISVGNKLLSIPNGAFDIQSDGTGGFIIDSGTTITYLPSVAYGALRKELVSLIKLPTADGSQIGLDLCYKISMGNTSVTKFPSLSFHFKGADFVLPPKNYMIFADRSGKLLCLAMMGSDDGVSIFGNVQQQNYQILYDLGKNMLSFSPALCETI
ncbi:aspartic proteinase nepenthesin-1 [Cryptomeria japonica]|uniref:aspartic proteinase nepenthesin-1 n=1 Tax=Cryptomeria japonica TaxID=3369 RepID=UPI0025ACAC70|nr:aspartic proteinase nepenthesin-1 [Cryptomeria japonica]